MIWLHFDRKSGTICSLLFNGMEFCKGHIGNLKVLEDIKSRDYDTRNFGFTGKEWDVRCDGFDLIESGPIRVVFRARCSFGVWQDKKPYYGTYLWHTPGVEYPTAFFTQDFIIYANDPMIRCVLSADRGKHRIEYAFLPHRAADGLPDLAETYERGIMVLKGNGQNGVRPGESLTGLPDCSAKITSIRLLRDHTIGIRAVDADKSIKNIIKD